MASVPSRKSYGDVRTLPSYTTTLPAIAEALTMVCTLNDRNEAAGSFSPASLCASRNSSNGLSSSSIASTASTFGRPSPRSVFEAGRTVQVNIKDYLVRMTKYAHCSPTVFICMVVYLDRFVVATGTPLTSSNVHRLLLTAFLVAAKLNDDIYYSNKYYASIGGVTLKEVNQMEAVFLEKTNWDMHVTRATYDRYVAQLKAFGVNAEKQFSLDAAVAKATSLRTSVLHAASVAALAKAAPAAAAAATAAATEHSPTSTSSQNITPAPSSNASSASSSPSSVSSRRHLTAILQSAAQQQQIIEQQQGGRPQKLAAVAPADEPASRPAVVGTFAVAMRSQKREMPPRVVLPPPTAPEAPSTNTQSTRASCATEAAALAQATEPLEKP